MKNYFSGLNYSLGDEDTSVELSMLPEGLAHVMSIAGSGGRALPLLARSPRRLTCVDISIEQLAVTKLRFAALKAFELPRYIEFLGYVPGMSPTERRSAFEELELSAIDRDWLAKMFDHLGWEGLVYAGRFERTLITFSRIVKAVLWAKGRQIFDCSDLDSQRRFFENDFPHRRWRLLLMILGNSAVLNSLLYRGQFPRNNLGVSSYVLYESIFHSLYTRLLARRSFFLQMVLLGRVVFEEGLPVECHPAVYERARTALASCDVAFVRGEFLQAAAASAPIDFLSISDVPSFLPDDAAKNYLQALAPILVNGGRIVARAHMRMIPPLMDGYEDATCEYADDVDAETTKLWRINLFRKS